MPTNDCCETPFPVNTITGYQSTTAVDLVLPTRGGALVVTRTYRSYTGVREIDGSFGIGWTWSYGVRARELADGSVAIVEADGSRSVFWANGTGWDPAQNTWGTVAANGSGGYTLTRLDGSLWEFNADGTLASITDRNGNSQTLTYSAGELTTVTGAGGRSLSVTTDSNGRITNIDGPGGLSASYTYDGSGRLLTATDPAGAVTTYTYDARHQMLTVVDGNSHTVETNTYGSLGRVTAQLDANNQLTSFLPAHQTFTGSIGASKMIDPLGNQTWYFFDQYLRLTQRITYQKVGSSLSERQRLYFTYDDRGNVLTQKVGFSGPVTSYTYDSRGNVLSQVVNSGFGGLALTTMFTWSSANELLTVTDPRSQTTTFTYDDNGNLLTVMNPLSETTTFTYDGSGQLTSVVNALSETTSFAYDGNGDLASVTEPGSIVTTLDYDAAGRLLEVTDPLNQTTEYTVNGRGQVTSATNALNQTVIIGYDAIGLRTSVTDALSRTTSYAYDDMNRLTSVTDALSQVTSYAYDANGNLTSVTDARSNQTAYTYDALGRPLSATDPLSKTTTYSYDERSNLIQTLDAKGTKNRFIYDNANRLTGIDLAYSSGTPVPDISYAYDAASRRTSMTDASGTTTYTYDNANRLLSVSAPVTGTVSYTYDALGRRASLTYPGQTTPVTYGYTARGQLDTVTDWLSNVAADYDYDAAGRLTDITHANGITTALDYNAANRLMDIEHMDGPNTLEAISYTLNAAGMRTAMTDDSGTTSWDYDAIDRLTEATYPNSDVVEYGYDAVGNRTSITVNSVATTNVFNAGDRMTSSDSGTVTYGYDDNGNLTSRTEGGVITTYAYDSLNRLTSVTGGTSYSYNGDGLRVSKTTGGTTTPFTWDPTGIGTLLSDGDFYLWGAGLIGRIDANDDATYAHQDGLGSIRLITDDTGAVVGSTEYDAFGTKRASSGVQYRLGYTGEQLDAETGFVYLRARYYDPGQGRFLTKDPFPGLLGQPASLHKYNYVGNSPLNYVDPSGLFLAGFEASGGGGFSGSGGFIGPMPVVGGGFFTSIANVLVTSITVSIGITPVLGPATDLVRSAIGFCGRLFSSDSSASKSINQLNQEIRTGKAPERIKRAERARESSETVANPDRDHVHINGVGALYRDGTWRHGGGSLTGAEKDWLRGAGWKLPE